jgi:uncharacterized membrane protein YgdD (TMEM256/DUF423 family)
MNNMKQIIFLAAVNGFLVVLLGAFGAHGLEERLTQARMATWQTAVQYHMFHTLALLGIGLILKACPDMKRLVASAWCLVAGIVMFSGSLYLLAVTAISVLGFITPFGGVAFLAGWAILAYCMVKE